MCQTNIVKINMLIYYDVLIKDFNTFMYDYALHFRKNISVIIVYKLLEQHKNSY